jgi:hypothetical protein
MFLIYRSLRPPYTFFLTPPSLLPYVHGMSSSKISYMLPLIDTSELLWKVIFEQAPLQQNPLRRQ